MFIKRIAKALLAPALGPMRPANILMIHIGRCGSTVVGELLDHHPRMHWVFELYSGVFLEWQRLNNGVETQGELPEDALKILRDSMQGALHRMYGVEMKPFHFQLIGFAMGEFITHLDSLGFTHYIILDRRNRLRKVISSVVAHQPDGSYHITTPRKPSLRPVHLNVDKIEIDFDSKPLLEFLRDYDLQFNSVRELLGDRPTLELTYEDDIENDPLKAYHRICEFVGLEPVKAPVKLSRTNPFPISQLIENFEELSNLLSGTPYEWMLESVPDPS
jgi:hypothetical protein